MALQQQELAPVDNLSRCGTDMMCNVPGETGFSGNGLLQAVLWVAGNYLPSNVLSAEILTTVKRGPLSLLLDKSVM